MWKNILTGTALFIVIGLNNLLMGQISISGNVSGKDNEPVSDAKIIISPENNPHPQLSQHAQSGKSGGFSIIFDQPPGAFNMSVMADGFNPIDKEKIYLDSGLNTINVLLSPIEKFSIDVSPDNDAIKLESSDLTKTITQSKIINTPSTRSTDIQHTIASMLPGAILGPDGKIHFAGDPANLHNWQLDCCNISDAITYNLETKLISPESISEIDLFSGRYSVDGGRGYATLRLYPETGEKINSENHAEFGYGATNFVPGFEFFRGFAVNDWKPRIYAYGPIKQNLAWFRNSTTLDYDRYIIYDEKNQSITSSWTGNNLLNILVRPTPKNIISSNFMVEYGYSPDFSLSPLHPPSTTSNRKKAINIWNIRNSYFVNPKTTLELGYGYYESYFRETPKGTGILEITPLGQRGFWPFNATRQGNRHQLFANISHEPSFAPGHRIKAGLDIQSPTYYQNVERTGIEHYRFDGSLSSRRLFAGSGIYERTNFEQALYVQDSWNLISGGHKWLPTAYVQLGLRVDKDRLINKPNITSRYSITLMPKQINGMKLSAGFGFIPSPYPISLLTRHLDQYALSKDFDRQGNLGVEFITIMAARPELLAVPRATNFSIGIEQNMPGKIKFKANYLRKRSRDFPTFVRNFGEVDESYIGQPLPKPEIDEKSIYVLTSAQKVWYDAVEAAVQRGGRYSWFVSYTRSKGKSNAALNAFIEDPIIFSDTAGPMPWDTPNRLLSYGFFELNKKNAVAYHLEYRTGFPFTSNDDDGNQIGAFNSQRFPNYFSVNVHYERTFHLFKRTWALRVGCDNCTNNPNYSFVNANTADPLYPRFIGKQPRKPIVLRIRTK
ncbi:MAG: carboxypeptidase-like regulatory domain-containing protein [bacterium]|nr:carboxypeptidase-like regulatory domain-containing protein [bacterium]